jgi:hypothetical protein
VRPLHNCGGIGADGTTHPELVIARHGFPRLRDRCCVEASLARTASSPCCLPGQRGLLMAPPRPPGIVTRAAAGRAKKKFGGRGRPSITKTERPRSANLLQMPKGPMCKLRQRGRGYGGPAGSRRIDPSLQSPPCAAIAGAVLYGRGSIPPWTQVKSYR